MAEFSDTQSDWAAKPPQCCNSQWTHSATVAVCVGPPKAFRIINLSSDDTIDIDEADSNTACRLGCTGGTAFGSVVFVILRDVRSAVWACDRVTHNH